MVCFLSSLASFSKNTDYRRRTLLLEDSFDLIEEAVDDAVRMIEMNSRELDDICKVDHCRLGFACGEDHISPCCLIVSADAKINTMLIVENPRAGLDLPISSLAFHDNNKHFDNVISHNNRDTWRSNHNSRTFHATVLHSTSDFLKGRHGLKNDAALKMYDERVQRTLSCLVDTPGGSGDPRVPLPAILKPNFALVEITSRFSDFDTTESLVRMAVETSSSFVKKNTTIWFNEIDYQAQAKEYMIDIRKCKLLLFGEPKLDAKVMSAFPKLGLIGFCQRILIFEERTTRTISSSIDNDGTGAVEEVVVVKVCFNDISKLCDFHYPRSSSVAEASGAGMATTQCPPLFDNVCSTLAQKLASLRLQKSLEWAIGV